LFQHHYHLTPAAPVSIFFLFFRVIIAIEIKLAGGDLDEAAVIKARHLLQQGDVFLFENHVEIVGRAHGALQNLLQIDGAPTEAAVEEAFFAVRQNHEEQFEIFAQVHLGTRPLEGDHLELLVSADHDYVGTLKKNHSVKCLICKKMLI